MINIDELLKIYELAIKKENNEQTMKILLENGASFKEINKSVKENESKQKILNNFLENLFEPVKPSSIKMPTTEVLIDDFLENLSHFSEEFVNEKNK